MAEEKPCWELIGDELVQDADLGLEIKQITQRMRVRGGWRVMVMQFWQEGDRLQKDTLTFRVEDGMFKWDQENWKKVRGNRYWPSQEVKPKLAVSNEG